MASRIKRISAGQNWLTGGGKLQFDLSFLPSGYRIDAATLCADLTMDAPAAGVSAEQQTGLLSGAECERRIRTTGHGLNAQDWQLEGKDSIRPAQLAQGNGQAVPMFWQLGFRDPRSIEPTDASSATAYYKGKALDVYCARPADILAGFAVTAGTAWLEFELSPLPEGTVPQSIVTGYVEVIGKEVKLPAGALVDLIMVKNDGSAITEAELGNMHLVRDGVENLLERFRLPGLSRSFNRYIARGAQVQGATDGVEGEALPANNVPFASVWHPVPPFKATKLPVAREAFVFTFDGTLAPNVARMFYRYVEPMDEVATVKAAAKLGYPVDADSTVDAKTASKNGVPADAPFKGIAGLMARKLRSRRR
jgi:hypothetical protein